MSAAAQYLGGSKIGSMVFYATVPICLFVGTTKRIDKQPCSVRFVCDKNWPKLHIDDLDEEEFHTEFCVAWQGMKFNAEKSLLVVEGRSDKAKNGYKLHLHLRGKRASRDA